MPKSNKVNVTIFSTHTEKEVLSIATEIQPNENIISLGYKAIQKHFGISETQARTSYFVNY